MWHETEEEAEAMAKSAARAPGSQKQGRVVQRLVTKVNVPMAVSNKLQTIMSNYPTEPKPESKNSVFANTGDRVVCGFPLLKIRDSEKNQGPAFDIVDETLYHFRINIFLRDFPIKSDADRLMIYLTFYAMKCLKAFGKFKNDPAKCAKEIESWNMNSFPLPGEGGFILSHLTTPPANETEKADIRNFLRQCRIETGKRLLKIVFEHDPKMADKWWICFAPRKFMDRDMQN